MIKLLLKVYGDIMENIFEGYKDQKVGEISETTITEIAEGKQGDFRQDSYWENADSSKSEIAEAKNQRAVELKTANGARFVINMPKTKEMHPKSLLSRFFRTYGVAPSVGLKVKTMLDKNGFNKILLQD